MNYTPRKTVVVPRKDDIPVANKVATLLLKHNLKLSYYSQMGCGFYRQANGSTDRIPVYDRFYLDRKETHLLLDKLKEIDELKHKYNELQSKFSSYQDYIDAIK